LIVSSKGLVVTRLGGLIPVTVYYNYKSVDGLCVYGNEWIVEKLGFVNGFVMEALTRLHCTIRRFYGAGLLEVYLSVPTTKNCFIMRL
jgi:hypothetical protein